MDGVEAIFRWLHVFAGIIWIGLLYFFNFVNAPFVATLDADSKKKVVPELLPRALFWFRWGAAWTWVTGVLLLLLIFYHGGLLFNDGFGWSAPAFVMLAIVFLGVFIYDALFKTKLAEKKKVAGLIGILLVAIVLWLMADWAGFSYRGYNIHIAAMFGTIMAFNVWFRIWPSQRKIITAVKNGETPDPKWVGLAGLRSRHNTYLSVPLAWGMVNAHTTYFAGGNLGIRGECAWVVMIVVILLGWHLVWLCYKKAGKIKGF